MFTGIVQELGQVVNIQKLGKESRFEISLGKLIEKNLEIGESIAINGACHTLESLSGKNGSFFSSQETLLKTNLGNLRIGSYVNLELSLTPSSRMGGHFVTGHVDGLSRLLSIQNINESYLLHFEVPSNFSKYMVQKGSVCLNGISLTIAEMEANSHVFSVAVIPHTWNETSLKYLRIGDLLNVELDLLAKYLEKLFAQNQSAEK